MGIVVGRLFELEDFSLRVQPLLLLGIILRRRREPSLMSCCPISIRTAHIRLVRFPSSRPSKRSRVRRSTIGSRREELSVMMQVQRIRCSNPVPQRWRRGPNFKRILFVDTVKTRVSQRRRRRTEPNRTIHGDRRLVKGIRLPSSPITIEEVVRIRFERPRKILDPCRAFQ